jgi:perosamine synthetase
MASILSAAKALVAHHARDPLPLISNAYGAREVVLTDSGTSALVLALQSVAPRGSLVALPAYGCIDLVAAAARARLRILLYDIDPETLAPDLASVQSAIRIGAGTVVASPIYGYPLDMPALLELARQNGVGVIEDAAQAAGCTLDDRLLGSFADMSILSFGRGKGTTAGGGGAVLLRGDAAMERAAALCRGMTAPRRGVAEVVALAAQWALARPATYAVPCALPFLNLGEMVYHAPSPPRMISRAARAALPSALRLAAGEIAVRQRRAAQFAAASSDTNLIAVTPIGRGVAGYLRFAVVDRVATAAPTPRLGIVRGYPIELREHPVTQAALEGGPDTPGARMLRDRLFTIPTHSRLTGTDIRSIESWLRMGGRLA